MFSIELEVVLFPIILNNVYYKGSSKYYLLFLKGSEKMANDIKNSIINGYLPSGLYNYFIPAENPIQ